MFKKLSIARQCFLFLCLSLTISQVFGQGKLVSGVVSGSDNRKPLAGVSVAVKGTKQGTITDAQGKFSINLKNNDAVLVFSTLSYQSKEVKVGNNSSLSVTLLADVKEMEDVVVIGYQSVRRKDLLASVSSISAKDMKDIPINSAAEAINGRLAGVTASTAEGSPDADIRIRVRGGMSITGDNSPLYIIDGVQVENGLSAISPQDILSIDVLKDAAATAIYGARGANGVIVITTKSGKVGRLQVNYNGFAGVKLLAKKLAVMSPYEFVLYQSERSRGSSTDSLAFIKNFGSFDSLPFYKDMPVVDWQKEVMGNTGFTQTHNINAGGGTGKLTYNFGYTYNNDKAIVINSTYKRHLLNFKSEYKVNSAIKMGVNVRYTIQDVVGAGVSDAKGSSYNRLRNSIKYRPFLSGTQELDDEDPLADPGVGNGLTLYNPIALANSEYRRKTGGTLNASAYLQINLAKNLSFKSTIGYNYTSFADRQYNDSISPYSILQGGRKPVVGLDTTITKTLTNSNVFQYSVKNIGNAHSFDIVLGEETYDLRSQYYSRLLRNYPTFTPIEYAFSNTEMASSFAGYPKYRETRYTSLSFFGRLNYTYQDRFLFSVNVRADGASKFAENNRWGYFPAASFAWRMKNESFLKNSNVINDMKLRIGVGTVGNNRIDDYLFLTSYRNDGAYYYGVNGQTVLGSYPGSLVNPDLKWESTVNRNIGVDLSLLKNRLNISLDYYNNQSKDLLLFVPISSTYGYTTQYQNIGKTSNKGAELQVSAVLVSNPKGLTWNASFNLAYNQNRIEQLGRNQQQFFPAASWGVSGQPTDYIIRVGESVGAMYGLVNDGFYTLDDFNYSGGIYSLKQGVVSNAGIIGVVQPGAIKFRDLNGDGVVDLNNDRKIIGNPNPRVTGGINQQFSFKQWDISLFVNFFIKNEVYNANNIEFTNGYSGNSNMLKSMENRWKVVTPTGKTAQWVVGNTVYGIDPTSMDLLNANAKIWQPIRSTGAFYPSSWAIEDGTFFRFNNFTIGYTVPPAKLGKLGMSKLRFYVTANNFAIITSYSGYDPEVSVRNSPLTPGLDYSAYPKSRSFIFGLNASF
jgi:TonB-linked SusC/RagA family outer membrane protein